MPARQRKTPTIAAPLYGPAARRAREAALDKAAAGSIAAKYGRFPSVLPEEPPASPVGELQEKLEAALARIRASDDEAATQKRISTELESRLAEQYAAAAAAEQLRAELAEALAANDSLRAQLDAQKQISADLGERIAERMRAVPILPPVPPVVVVADSTGPQLVDQSLLARAPVRFAIVDEIVAPVPVPAAPQVEPRLLAAIDRATLTRKVSAPLPAVPSRRGLVGKGTPLADLLLMAPPRPGGHAGHCFAELLDRAARKGGSVNAAEDDLPGDPVQPDRRWRDDLQALAALYRDSDGFYRDLPVPPSDRLPLNGDRMRINPTAFGGGSISSQCAEG